MVRPLSFLALIALSGIAVAQSYPSRPVTLISPFPPGGSTDTAARIIAERMRPALGQPAVIETVAGKAEIEKWWPVIKAANIKVE